MIGLVTQYKIKVIYKNGVTQDFWVNDFEAQKKVNGDVSVSYIPSGYCRPMLLGLDDVTAIWMAGTRTRIGIGKYKQETHKIQG